MDSWLITYNCLSWLITFNNCYSIACEKSQLLTSSPIDHGPSIRGWLTMNLKFDCFLNTRGHYEQETRPNMPSGSEVVLPRWLISWKQEWHHPPPNHAIGHQTNLWPINPHHVHAGAPPVYKLVISSLTIIDIYIYITMISPTKTIVIGVINQLSYRTGAPACIIMDRLALGALGFRATKSRGKMLTMWSEVKFTAMLVLGPTHHWPLFGI